MLKNLSNQHTNVYFEVEPTTTVGEFREMIIDKAIQLYWPNEDTPDCKDRMSRIRIFRRPWPHLYYNSKTLETEHTLAHYGIKEESTVYNAYGLGSPIEKKNVKKIVKKVAKKVAKKITKKGARYGMRKGDKKANRGSEAGVEGKEGKQEDV